MAARCADGTPAEGPAASPPGTAARRRKLPLYAFLAVLAAAALEMSSFLLSTSVPRPRRFDVTAQPIIEADPDTIWRYKPNAPIVYEVGGRTIRSATNGFGVHDSEWTPARLARPDRALALGDSFSFGWGVDLAEVWWKQLGTIDPDLEVFGAGWWFSTFDQHYLFAKRFVPVVRPRLVLYALFIPHVVTELTRVHHLDASGDLVRVSDPVIGVHGDLLTYSVDGANAFSPMGFPFLLSYPRRLLEQRAFDRRYRELLELRLSERISYDDPLLRARAAVLEPGFAKLFASLRLMDAHARANGAEYVVTMIPAVGQVLAGRLAAGVAAHERDVLASSHPQSEVAEFCRAQGIRCVDPLQRFRGHPRKDELYLADDPHLSARGHRLLAEAVAEVLSASRAGGSRPSASALPAPPASR